MFIYLNISYVDTYMLYDINKKCMYIVPTSKEIVEILSDEKL